MADEIEIKLNSSFNNQLKYAQSSEPSVKKIQCILDVLDIQYDAQVDCYQQKDTYFDTCDRALLKEKNSLRIRVTEDTKAEVTSKHFLSYDINGQHHRKEDTEAIKPEDKHIEILLSHAGKYFPKTIIETDPVVITTNNRTSFMIYTQIAGYLFCLDKFRFSNADGSMRSDDYYEIELEEISKAGNVEKNGDSQLGKLAAVFRDVFEFTPTEINKYAKGVDWLHNPISQKDMQYIEFDIADYSSKNTPLQKSMIKSFTQIVIDSLHECNANDCLKIPVGDGVILSIEDTSDKALKIVQRVSEKLLNHNSQFPALQFELRSAVHYGHILMYQDINNNPNLAGKGINMTARIISMAEKGQILISDAWYDNYKDMGIIPDNLIKSGCFSKPFEIKVKHGVSISVRNFKDDSSGMGIEI
jgi:uncharacterized protein YjbK